MQKHFDNAFDDFLTERMGEDIARLKEKNGRYKAALDEHSELIRMAQNKGIDDYRQAFNRLAELGEYIRDLECHYLFYAGMAAYKKMGDAVSSFDLAERFAE